MNLCSTLPPFITAYDKARQHVCRTVRYNATGQKLDIWRPDNLDGPAPVLLFVPGGGWVIGRRRGQAHALMAHLVRRGWICVAIDYRTAPRNLWPACFLDVKQAMLWTREHIAEYGGDPNFVVMAGGSAGGHMASLAGLAGDHPCFPLEDVRPDAVISLYGVYDWTFRGSVYHQGFAQILERVIVGKTQRHHPDVFLDASPVSHVRADAPPFLILHGSGDWLTPVGGARRFHEKLAAVSQGTVTYHEIPGAVHAFDLLHPGQGREAIRVIDTFLADVQVKVRVAA